MKKIIIILVFLIMILNASFFVSADPTPVTVEDLYRVKKADHYAVGDYNQGYYRAQFNIPTGTIWKAVADIGEHGILYVNGELVDFMPDLIRYSGGSEAYRSHSVDLKPYLDAGQTNCIALFFKAQGSGRPNSLLQGKVIMADGDEIFLDMKPGNPDVTWRAIDVESDPDWNTIGFHENGWSLITQGGFTENYIKIYERWPGYDGRLVFENPHSTEDRFFFNEDLPIRVNVVIPEGLSDLSGTIHWFIEEAIDGGTYSSVDSGTQDSFSYRSDDDSIVYELNLGTLPRGVYTLEIYLRDGSTTIESRLPEPFVVVGEIPMNAYNADEIEDGLSYTLEAEIDFTDSSNTEWTETRKNDINRYSDTYQVYQADIVDTGDLVYRQTYPEKRSMFSYQYTFDEPGSWYLMVLEYPDDANRRTGLAITRIYDLPDYRVTDFRTESGPMIITGYKYPLTREMKELKWLHRADRGLHSIDVVSVSPETSAAAKKIRIYRVNGNLPELDTTSNYDRQVGLYTESTIGMQLNFGIDFPGVSGGASSQNTYLDQGFNMLQIKTQRLLFELDSVEHYTQYLRFKGENMHIAGTYMYYDNKRSYQPAYKFNTVSYPADIREVALRVFEANGIDMMSMIEYNNQEEMRDMVQFDPVNKDGVPVDTEYHQSRITEPYVQKAFHYTMDDIAFKFSNNPAWKGLFFTIYPGYWGPTFYSVQQAPYAEDPLDYDFADETIAEFETDTGISVPGTDGDPGRFNERYNFLTGPRYDEWIAWRSQYVHDLMIDVRDMLHSYRSDLNLVQAYYLDMAPNDKWVHSGRPWPEFMREYGLDPTLYSNDDNMWISRYMFPTERNRFIHYPIASYRFYYHPSLWEAHTNDEVISFYEQTNKRSVSLHVPWAEIDYHYTGTGSSETWPIDYSLGRFQGKYSDHNSQETYAQAMIGSDPEKVFLGFNDVGITVVDGQEMRNFVKVLTALPRQRFQDVLSTGFETNLAIKELQYGGTYWFYVVNPGYWKTTATINLENINSVVDVLKGNTISTSSGDLVFDIEPYEVRAFRASTSNGRIRGYSISGLSNNDLEYMRNLVKLGNEIFPQVDSQISTSLIPRTDEDDAFVVSNANAAEQDLNNGNYASAWLKLTNWNYWRIAGMGAYIQIILVPSFTSEQTSALTKTFDGTSTLSYWEPIVSYEWNFGDGNTGSGRITSHTYNNPGTYNVRLTVTDKSGRIDTTTKDVFVSDQGFIEGDVNEDDDIDIYDLVAVAVNFGRRSGFTYPRADTDTNGVIDIFDIVYVATRIP